MAGWRAERGRHGRGASVLQRGAILAEGDYQTVSQNPQVLEAYMGSATVLEGAH